MGWIGIVLIAIAVLGTITSLGITRVPPSGSSKKFVINPLAEIWDGTQRLYTDRPLWLTVMGISYFWFLGAFLQMVLPLLGKDVLQLGETRGPSPRLGSVSEVWLRADYRATRSSWDWYLWVLLAWDCFQ